MKADFTPKRPNPTVPEGGSDVWGLVILIGYVVIAAGMGLAYVLGLR